MKKQFCSSVLLFVCISLSSFLNAALDVGYTVSLVKGKELKELIPFIAQCRVDLFKGYPYLYEGTVEEGVAILTPFIERPAVAIAVAYYHNKPIAYATGNSLVNEMEWYDPGYLAAFKEQGVSPDDHYYIPDVIVMPEHQGRGLVRPMLNLIEEHASLLGYKYVSLATESHEEHPLKPKNYRELETYWFKQGFSKTPIRLYSSWTTEQVTGPALREKHELVYWVKALQP